MILERLSPAVVALRQLRGRDRPADPGNDLGAALSVARHYVDIGRTYADPRAYGYAQAALGRWWSADPAPPELLVMRARILQFRHDFDGALAQLEAALKASQFDADAWMLFASLAQVRGNVRAARAACLKLIPLADPLIGATCAASTASLGGRAGGAASLLAHALEQATGATPGERAWAWTTLAEILERSGDATGEEAAFRSALSLVPGDVYTQAAYADFLLDADRAGDVLVLLGADGALADATLLRAAIAASRCRAPTAIALNDALARRFDEARARGDETHLREQARFALELHHDVRLALDLARRNFAVQREPGDARILLESALAAGDAAAAQPAIDWLDAGGGSPRLFALEQRLRSGARQ